MHVFAVAQEQPQTRAQDCLWLEDALVIDISATAVKCPQWDW